MNAIHPAAEARRIFALIDEGQFDAAREAVGTLAPHDTVRELAEAELAFHESPSADARSRVEQAGAAVRATGDSFGAVRALLTLAAADRAAGNVDMALNRLRTARDVAGDADDILASVLLDVGTTLLEAGRAGEAAGAAREAFGPARRSGDAALEGAAYTMAASALAEANDPDVAQAVLDEAVMRLNGSGDATARASLRVLQGRLLVGRGRLVEAIAVLREALTAVERLGEPRLEAFALEALREAVEASAEKGAPVGRAARVLVSRPKASVRRTAANEIVFSGDNLPTWTAAKRSLERFILENALQQTSNNRAAAGRMLKITKVAVHHACKRHGFGGVQEK